MLTVVLWGTGYPQRLQSEAPLKRETGSGIKAILAPVLCHPWSLRCLHFLPSCPPNNWRAHADMVREGAWSSQSFFKKRARSEEKRNNIITLGGLWEREEGCRVTLHWNSSSWGLYIWNVFTNLRLRSQMVLLWDGNRQHQNHAQTADELSLNSPLWSVQLLFGCLCWHRRQHGSARDDSPLDHCFTEWTNCLMKTGWKSLLFWCHVNRVQLFPQLCAFSPGRTWLKAQIDNKTEDMDPIL